VDRHLTGVRHLRRGVQHQAPQIDGQAHNGGQIPKKMPPERLKASRSPVAVTSGSSLFERADGLLKFVDLGLQTVRERGDFVKRFLR
jgi:hypothetical protein